jgi:hypothetical protein
MGYVFRRCLAEELLALLGYIVELLYSEVLRRYAPRGLRLKRIGLSMLGE